MARSAPARAARVALLAAGVLATAVRPRGAELPSMPGPAGPLARHADAAAENARCEQCHADIAAEQRGSLHRASFVEPAFVRAFALEPTPFCQGCHAPEAAANAPVPKALAAIGTACVTCHLTADGVLAAPRVEPAPRAPHRVVRDARFASDGACAGCHEFFFPGVGLPRPRELMQSTVTEHRASAFSAFSCADCHMPRVDGSHGKHKSHEFIASRSPERVRAAASVRAERRTPTAIRITLGAEEIGHAFPTGDLFRRLTLHAEAGDARVERHLMRRFGEHRVGLAGRRVQIGDDRVGIGGAERVVDLELGPAAAGLPARYRVDYERVQHPLSRDGEEAIIEGTITLAEGVVAAEGDR